MKKRNLFVVISALLLVGCSSSRVEARPDHVIKEDVLVDVNEGDKKTDIYNNEFTDLYQSLVDAGTTNSNVVDELVKTVAKKEIGTHKAEDGFKTFAEVGFITEERFNELVDEYMTDIAKGGSYTEDYLFHEEKFVRDQREALYTITDNTGSPTTENFNEPLLITPDIEFVDVFGVKTEATEEAQIAKGREKYKEYREKVVEPIIYKRLLTSKYLMNVKYKSLGRAAARNVRVITIDNSKPKDSGSAIRTLNNYIGGYLYVTNKENNIPASEVESYFPTIVDGKPTFDVKSLARIWQGVYGDKPNELEQKELAFIDGKNATGEKLYTVNQETIVDEIEEIAVKDINGKWVLKEGLDVEDSHITELLSKYTGSYAYPIDWGVTLEERKIQTTNIVEDDFFIKKTGLTSLPDSVRNRLFENSIEENISTIDGTNFLLPEKKANLGEEIKLNSIENCIKAASNYIHHDADSKTYYVVIVDEYKYSTAEDGLGKELTEATKDKALEVAILLGEDSTQQTDAITHYFKTDNDLYEILYHDSDFYDYMKANYPDIFED